jgi:hypothetical protein
METSKTAVHGAYANAEKERVSQHTAKNNHLIAEGCLGERGSASMKQVPAV